MRINHKVLSIPPFISTAWKNITSIHCEYKNSVLVLVITLTNDSQIEIPNLETPVVEAVFSAHAKYLELLDLATNQKMNVPPKIQQNFPSNGAVSNDGGFAFPLQIGAGGIENLGSILQHNPEQSDSPDLPKEILSKIASISKAVGIEDANLLPKPEPHCNCFHCQISKAILGQEDENQQEEMPEEIVSDADLKFRLWDVAQSTDQLYIVTNPIDTKEHYNVFLGNPIGCTCGEKNCEHIKAVLNS